MTYPATSALANLAPETEAKKTKAKAEAKTKKTGAKKTGAKKTGAKTKAKKTGAKKTKAKTEIASSFCGCFLVSMFSTPSPCKGQDMSARSAGYW